MSITLNADGMISDDDKLYKQLDEWHDNDRYDEIVSAVTGVPQEKWSNKLWFRLISAYNNLKQYDKAREELQKIYPRIESAADWSRWYYMSGYIFDVNRKELTAIHCYEDGLEADPDDTVGLDLNKEIESCRGYVEKDLKNLRELSEKITKDIKKRYAQMPYSEKYELSDEEFTLQLSFLPGIRKIPGHERGPGFKEYFLKYKDGQKRQAEEWLERLFGITDRESFIDFFRSSRDCNIAHFADDVIAKLNGKPNFDVSELNKDGRRLFEDVTLFVGTFADLLPEAGVSAWDISEKIGFLRHAYAVDYITNSDYCACMLSIMDDAKARFSSAEEYLISLALGSGLYMFLMDDSSISSGTDFILKTAAFLLQSDLPDIRWKE